MVTKKNKGYSSRIERKRRSIMHWWISGLSGDLAYCGPSVGVTIELTLMVPSSSI